MKKNELLVLGLSLLALSTGWSLAVSANELPNGGYVTDRSLALLTDLEAHMDSLVGLELLIAQPDASSLEALFGHVMIRFVRDDGPGSRDVVLEFDSDLEGGRLKPSAIRAILGGYKVLLDLSYLQDHWNYYVVSQHRPIERYVLVSNPALRAQLVTKLRQWAQNPAENLGNYSYLSENCASVLERLLDEAGFPRNSLLAHTPEGVRDSLWNGLIDPFPALILKNPLTENAPPSDTLDQALALLEMPKSLYSICSDASCAGAQVEAMRQVWSKREIHNSFNRWNESYEDLFHPEWRVQSPKQAEENPPHAPVTDPNEFQKNLQLLYSAETGSST